VCCSVLLCCRVLQCGAVWCRNNLDLNISMGPMEHCWVEVCVLGEGVLGEGVLGEGVRVG